MRKILWMVSVPMLVSGCGVTRGTEIREVSSWVEQRGGAPLPQEESSDSEIRAKTEKLLQEELTPETAVQIALLNNRTFHADLEEVGIAQADLGQAALPDNPHFEGGIGYSSDRPEGVGHWTITQNILSFFSSSPGSRAANAQLQESKYRAGHAALELIARVKSGYYALQGARHLEGKYRASFEAASAAAELAEGQHKAGNINGMELVSHQALAREAEIDLARQETETAVAREELSELMGVQNEPIAWKIRVEFPDMPSEDPSGDQMEALALDQRLDLAAARHKVNGLEYGLEAVGWQTVPNLHLGVEYERDPEGEPRVGPELEVDIPIFDRAQAKGERLTAQVRQSRKAAAGLEVQIRREVRAARVRLTEARRRAELYRDRVMPLREKMTAEAQRHYNQMFVGIYHLLEIKREEIAAHREYLNAVRDYWTARANLELAVGGRLGAPQGGK